MFHRGNQGGGTKREGQVLCGRCAVEQRKVGFWGSLKPMSEHRKWVPKNNCILQTPLLLKSSLQGNSQISQHKVFSKHWCLVSFDHHSVEDTILQIQVSTSSRLKVGN